MRDVPASPNIFYNKGGICPQGSSQLSCRAIIPGTFPDSIGGGTLLAAPDSPDGYVKLGFRTDTEGSLGYSPSDPADYFGHYATNFKPTTDILCDHYGYLYHQRSGLCVTAVAQGASSPNKWNGALMQLQPCDCTGPNPPEAQLFCGFKFPYQDDLLCSRVFVLFQDISVAMGYLYGFASGEPSSLALHSGNYLSYTSCELR